MVINRSEKDDWHRGDYKQHTNAVQAIFFDGTKQVIFKITEPGFPTEIAMNISKPTVKRVISDLLEKGLIVKHGKGAGTNYSIK